MALMALMNPPGSSTIASQLGAELARRGDAKSQLAAAKLSLGPGKQFARTTRLARKCAS